MDACNRLAFGYCVWYNRFSRVQFRLLMDGVIPVIFAAFFKAVCDSMEHHPDVWPFTAFWNTRHPGNDKVKRIFSYPLDGWHLSNSLMIVSFISIVFVKSWQVPVWQFLVYGCLFVVVFNLFYNKVFR
jgi:hypothetical protein